MAKTKQCDRVQVSFRVPVDVKDKLREMTGGENYKMTQVISEIVREAHARYTKRAKAAK